MTWEKFKLDLANFVAIKSISTDVTYLNEIEKAVSFLYEYCEAGGLAVERVDCPNSNPVIIASTPVRSDLSTILIYGHYDVQPALPDGWHADPFRLHEQDGRLFARGVVDNKGQILIHLFSTIQLLAQGTLKYNVKFLIEGNEESGNPDLGKLIQDRKTQLACDNVIISDGQTVGRRPTIEAGLRGGGNFKLIYRSSGQDLHSGLYGGIAPNPAYEMACLISQLFDKNGKCLVPGFYDDVDSISPDIRKANLDLSNQRGDWRVQTGTKKILSVDNNDPATQIGLYPTLQVSGMLSGYVGNGFMNIVPAQSEVRLNLRTVASQSFDKICDELKKFIEAHTPEYIDWELTHTAGSKPVKLDLNTDFVLNLKQALAVSYKDDPVIVYCGGGIPIVLDLQQELGVDPVLVSLGNEDCRMHGVNENFLIEQARQGLDFSLRFLSS